MTSLPDNPLGISCKIPDTKASVVSVCRPATPGPEPRRPATSERWPRQGSEQLDVPLDQTAEVPEVGEYPPQLPKIDISVWGTDFKAGRVSKCAAQWATITSDHKILSHIRNFKLDFKEPPFQVRAMPELRFFEVERDFLKTEIQSLLQKEVLVTAKHTAGEFVSNVFLREKQEPGHYRMILNLKHLNKFVEKHHFKIETLISTLSLVTPGCSFLSFDFSDAYYSCSVFPPHRKYLRFTFEGYMSSLASPMGLLVLPGSSQKSWKLLCPICATNMASLFPAT